MESNGFTQELEKRKLSIYKSLAEFQQECPVIHQGTKGYGYTYAGLPEIFGVINPLLKKNGLGFMQLIEGTSIVTTLFHVETGETITSKTEIPQGVSLAKMNEFQVMGSAVTYIRRYALSSMLGIITDKDTDAGGKAVKEVKKPTAKQKIKITDEQFKAICEGLSSGNVKYTPESIINAYNLDAEQIEQIKGFISTNKF